MSVSSGSSFSGGTRTDGAKTTATAVAPALTNGRPPRVCCLTHTDPDGGDVALPVEAFDQLGPTTGEEVDVAGPVHG